MSRYGIKLVWAGWHNEDVIGFSPKAYEEWKNDIQVGTRMLIYETDQGRELGAKGKKAIVGEVEVIEGFAASEGLATPTQQHDIPVKVRVIRRREEVSEIPLKVVRKITADPNFAHVGQAWKPIFETMYRDFIKLWGGR